MKIIGTLVVLLFAFGATAQEFDIAVAGKNWLCGVGVPFVRDGVEFSPGGAAEENTNILTIAAGGRGRILAGVNGTDVEIVELHPDLTRTPFFAGVPGSVARALVVDAAGTVYVIATAGVAPSLIEISPAGTLVSNQPFPYSPVSIDLAADQCTLFVADGTSNVRRYDVCANTPLANFVSLPFGSTGSFLRILPDGGIVVSLSTGNIVRYDAAGTLVRTYDLELYFSGALALGNGGMTLLAGADCERRVIELDLATGTVLREIPQQFVDRARDIVSARGFTAAIGALAASDVPLRGPLFLLTLGLALAFGAVWKLH
jgi:hypothetical protein